MTRTASRIDKNQTEIVAGLRKAGYSVLSLASLAKGCPDILVGKRSCNVLLEIKYGKGKLNKQQLDWHDAWCSPVHVVRSIGEALIVMGLYTRRNVWVT